jgi:hypothetical protein
MEASKKNPVIESLLTSLTGVSRVGAVHEASCVMCGGEARVFRDDLSRKEYAISAMCQDCQDKVFGFEEE